MIVEYDNSAKHIKEKINFYEKQLKDCSNINRESLNSKITYYKNLYYDLTYVKNKFLKKIKE